MKAPQPSNESERLEALRRYEVLDTIPEQAFDDLALLAAQICQVPLAQISLVDEHRQWFKAKIGLEQAETPRDIAFCAHTILHADEVMVVKDARIDLRFADSPLVTADPHVRFYAGAPLVTPSGHALGALCVMDTKPRSLAPEQLAALQALSRRVVAQLELRRQAVDLVAKEREASRLLLVAEKSRRALLSVLEDEKHATQSLRESETRFRQMAESIDEVFWMSDVEKKAIVYISPGYEQIWGRPCAELYASMNSWVESIYEEDRIRVLSAAATKQATGEYNETYRIIRPDGAVRWIRDRAFPVKEVDGRVRRVVGVAEDITERKKLEEQFLHAQRMEAIGTLAGGVAHDLNNILAPVLMVAGLLQEKLTDSRDVAMLKMVESSAQRGADIIRQLLSFSRGGIEGAHGRVQLKHLIKDMVHIMQETFPRNIMIEQTVPNDLWTVLADATQMHQVLMNLCVNARDAMPEGGRLALRAENLQLTGSGGSVPQSNPGPHVRITVADTGTGIPAAIIERIFDPFFTTKEVGKGTGLGLSTVIGIVKNHGGFMSVDSEPGKGTVFTVCLPATDTTAVPADPSSLKVVMAGRGELILVVDDEEAIRTAIRQLLEKHHYRVRLARDGREAASLFLANQDSVRLVVTDVMMPVMGGLELVRALRTVKPGLEIIAMTGLGGEEKIAGFAALGVTEVLLKPFVPEDLLAAIRRQLDRRPAS